jgi:hypothetical protein
MTPHPELRIRTPKVGSPRKKPINALAKKLVTCLLLSVFFHIGIYIHTMDRISLYVALFFLTISLYMLYSICKSEDIKEVDSAV